ncbi:anti-sigma factor [Kribbella solani]|uniref:anti-sigma factor n=1 Tax=Kribbella solani TaxID=236067 RepID=UPI0029AB4121|nr:anti-sigma factor [Kribbella solani]MDX2967895.1 anti-sigma factor [Kribbella solani]MDX3005127.1 anti-sigma factor [Kribbella solani]
MTDPDVHTLAGPYVLDALPAPERTRFEAHLKDCAFCRTEVDELREAAVKLATQVATPPPPHLKASVMAAIDQVRQLPPQIRGEDAPAERRYSRRSVLALAAAAVAAATAGGVAIDQYRRRSEQTEANQRISAILAQPDARTVHGAVSGGGQATVVTSARANAAVVVLKDLPKLPAQRTWQLWMIDTSQQAHSIGLATGDETQVIDGNVTGKATFGLTIEPAGGSPSPTLPAAALIPLT